jgi:endonuclease-3
MSPEPEGGIVTTDTDTATDSETDVRSLHRDLVELHGKPADAHSEDGVRQLVTTILSQNVADAQTAQAARELFAAYPDYEAIRTTDADELAETIAVAGLKNQKAARIQRSLGRIREETGGEYTLAFLEGMPTAEARDWLTDIKGVGPKTASVVLNFHFQRPTMAVDTHVERLSKRYGLVPETASNERAHDVLDELVPDDLKYPLHVLLIQHGKTHCTARSPDCANPVCERYCDCGGC